MRIGGGLADLKEKKVYFTPSSIEGGLLSPLNYETVYFTP
jgi:hypothetical protein